MTQWSKLIYNTVHALNYGFIVKLSKQVFIRNSRLKKTIFGLNLWKLVFNKKSKGSQVKLYNPKVPG